MSSADYWLLEALCPACRPPRCDHEHCDPDRCDNPSQLCICPVEIIPLPREESP